MSFPKLDPVIHQQVRLAIVGMLDAAHRIDFRMLRDELELFDSNLSQHLSRLESAGYIRLDKRFAGKTPRTWVSLTRAGRAALAEYVATLNSILRKPVRSV